MMADRALPRSFTSKSLTPTRSVSRTRFYRTMSPTIEARTIRGRFVMIMKRHFASLTILADVDTFAGDLPSASALHTDYRPADRAQRQLLTSAGWPEIAATSAPTLRQYGFTMRDDLASSPERAREAHRVDAAVNRGYAHQFLMSTAVGGRRRLSAHARHTRRRGYSVRRLAQGPVASMRRLAD